MTPPNPDISLIPDDQPLPLAGGGCGSGPDGASDPAMAEPPPADPVPFPEHLLPEAIDAATRLWESLAARAWEEFAVRGRGRGVLLLRWDELREAAVTAAQARRRDPIAPLPDVPATWVTATIIHRGDDFRGLLQRSDPTRQVMLIVGHEDGGEALFALESGPGGRPDPESCWRGRSGADHPVDD